MTPFFSIIIPTYNRARTIRRPIDSILAQTFTDWELIIVDDGSTDDTKDVVFSYIDNRIRYFWQKNQERSAARNYGISLSQGKWICFQDSDDEYLSNHLQVLYDAIHQDPEFKVFRTGLFVYNKGTLVTKSGRESSKYDQFPFECFTTCAFHHTVLSDIQFDPKVFTNEDLHFMLKIGMRYEIKVFPIWTGIYHYDPKSSGGVGPNYEKNLMNKKKCLDDILSWNKHLIQVYLKKTRCLTEVLLLVGHFKYNKSKILPSIKDNISVFIHYPRIYFQLIMRIVYVKVGELSGLYRTQDRF